MLGLFKKIFSNDSGEINGNIKDDNHLQKLKFGVAILFVEVAKVDGDFSDQERSKIISVLNEEFEMIENEAESLIDEAESEIKVSDSIYEYTVLINQAYSNERKFELLKNLWRLIYDDQNVDIYEDHLVKKIGGLLNAEHQTIIAAKLLVKEEMNL